ncbi:MAG: EamA family transporter [Chloroflexota bacterium]
MDWANAALLSAAIVGAVNIVDSYFLSRRLPSLRSFLLPVGAFYLLASLIFLLIYPLPEGVGSPALLAGLGSGLLRTVSVIILLSSLTSEEVSRVIPIVFTSPIFVALIALPLLGERLPPLEWLAVVMVVAGAVLVSLRPSPSGKATWHLKPLLLLSLSSLLFALADVASKYALGSMTPQNLFWLSSLCLAVIFLLFSFNGKTLKQLASLERKGSALAALVANEAFAVVGIILSLWAIERGPVSLVSTIGGSRPFFVLIYAFILSRLSPGFLDWQPGRKWLALRVLATLLVISGIAIINLV